MSRAEAADLAYRDSLNTLVRKVLVISLALGCPSIIAMIFVLGPSDPVVRWAYPPLLVHLLVYAWVLIFRPERAVPFSRMTLVLLESAWVVAMVLRVRTGPLEEAWAGLFPTFFMALVIFVIVGFLFFGTRVALLNAGGVVGAVVVGTLVAFLPVEGGSAYLLPMMRFALAMVVVSLLLHVLSRAKAGLALAVAAAQRATEEALEMRDMAYLDSLTGVANRRRLVEELSFQSSRALPDHPVAVVYFDLDRFKAINDEHGHTVGDDVLCKVAEVCVAEVRHRDVVGRLGGEEFVIVSPGTDYPNALQLAERLRATLPAELRRTMGVPVTASFGVTMLQLGESASHVLDRVDGLMYEAKNRGRDQVSGAVA